MLRGIQKTLFFIVLSASLTAGLHGQAIKGLSGELKARYMSTNNHGDLTDFSVAASFGYLKYQYNVNSWLSFGVQVNALANFGTENIDKRDPLTLSGPIYEGNLWNGRLMNGSAEFALPQLFTQLTFDSHNFTLGRFTKNTPLINAEPWPFPNAIEGLWYDFNNEDTKLRIQAGLITGIAPRFSGRFESVGGSVGVAGIGVGLNGAPSGYRGNTNSDYIGIIGLDYQLTEQLTGRLWNYYTENLMNVTLLELAYALQPTLTLKTLFMGHFKVGDGGNSNLNNAYITESNAYHLGLRLQKDFPNSFLQFNFSRTTDDGRFSLPREWGLEPFYTFLRRTRFEGQRNVTSLMVKWQKQWNNEKSQFRFYSSFRSDRMPDPDDALRNKWQLPSSFHLDASIKYTPKPVSKKLGIEIYTAYRFLNDAIDNNENYRINRADFYHFDLILSYKLFQ